MADYSELLNYLEAQAELGEDEVFFEEPWSVALLKKRPAAAPVQATQTMQQPAPRSTVQTSQPQATPIVAARQNTASRVQILSGIGGGRSDALDLSALAPREEATPTEFLSATSLAALNASLAKHTVYQGANFIGAEGMLENPEVLLVFDSPRADDRAPSFMQSAVGQMLFRMFAALQVDAGKCAMTYVYKRFTDRAPSAMLDVTLRQMLEKEVSLIRPAKIVVFGEIALRQIFGRDKSFRTFAGNAATFAGTPSVALHDARQMLTNVALKKETWNVHLPKCGLFNR